MDVSKLNIIKDTFFECLQSTGIFRRAIPDIPLVEVNDIEKSNRRWIVFAAGIDSSEANELFAGDNKRKERAKLPLLTNNDASISLKLVIRPFEFESVTLKNYHEVTSFAPKRGLPLIEIRDARIRLEGIPKNDNGLTNLRWDFNLIDSLSSPYEKWLNPWQKDIGFNPAHYYSHIHMNYNPISDNEFNLRPGDTVNNLRLAVGTPNPLALLLSISAWISSFP